jgi:hypothetical protein
VINFINDFVKKYGLNGNQLKLVAIISMTIDHIGILAFPQYVIFRIIGRVSFPIFAYMIGEGMFYTRNRLNYLLRLLVLGIVCQVAYSFVDDGSEFNIILTWSMSVVTIILYDKLKEKGNTIFAMAFPLYIIGIFIFCEFIPNQFAQPPYTVDYGFAGVILPLLCYIPKKKYIKLFLLSLGMVLLVITLDYYQYWCYLSVLFLFFYNGKRGKYKMKNFFYIYYPAHLALIWIVVTGGLLL